MSRRVVAGLFAVSVFAWSVAMSWARPPATEAGRRQRVDELYASYAKAFLDVPAIGAAEALSLVGDPGVVFVDVREPAEQAVSMIPGAVTREAFDADPARYAGKQVVTYCTIGARSGAYAQQLMGRGVEVRNLAGSLLAWTHEGGPLERDGEPTRDVHVYGARWALQAEGYRGIW